MIWHKATLHLRGPTGTPWQADTIFGHLCWALRHRRGETALQDLLGDFCGGLPHFLLSDGFPGDLLPRPLLLSMPQDDSLETFREGRNARKVAILSPPEFERALRGETFFPQRPAQGMPVPRVTLKNQISRLTGTTGDEGRLFPFTEYWTPEVTIYLKIEPGFEDQVKELFDWLVETGYGKRKSVGYGAIDSYTFEKFEGFPVLPDANAFVSLSNFVPAEADPVEGRWRIL
ncbi:MAG: hypothetical protein Q8O76_11745, partial [Chloroflexota bacterium]|nr:hypothetical protein [Chloroflexota bacterium]